MDYNWLGMRSEPRRLTTELIESRLTKDLPLGGTGGRDESAVDPKTLGTISNHANVNLMEAFR